MKTQKNYFTLEEMCKSDTANALNIVNVPNATVITHLNELIEFLNPLREAWGSAIRVNSGYRCPQLNRAVGGSKTSVHVIGYAADLYPINGKMKEFKKFVVDYLTNNCSWDQLLLEKSAFDEWIHIGLYDNYGRQRKQIKNINV